MAGGAKTSAGMQATLLPAIVAVSVHVAVANDAFEAGMPRRTLSQVAATCKARRTDRSPERAALGKSL